MARVANLFDPRLRAVGRSPHRAGLPRRPARRLRRDGLAQAHRDRRGQGCPCTRSHQADVGGASELGSTHAPPSPDSRCSSAPAPTIPTSPPRSSSSSRTRSRGASDVHSTPSRAAPAELFLQLGVAGAYGGGMSGERRAT
jgi:hypothetical protein